MFRVLIILQIRIMRDTIVRPATDIPHTRITHDTLIITTRGTTITTRGPILSTIMKACGMSLCIMGHLVGGIRTDTTTCGHSISGIILGYMVITAAILAAIIHSITIIVTHTQVAPYTTGTTTPQCIDIHTDIAQPTVTHIVISTRRRPFINKI